MRRQFMAWLVHDVARVAEGCMMPKWCYAIRCLLFPMQWSESRFYDAQTDTYTIQGVRYTGALFSYFAQSKVPGKWVRVTRRDGGVVTLEEQTEATNGKA
jgi:hypothetical protein